MSIVKNLIFLVLMFCSGCGAVIATGVSHTFQSTIDKRTYFDQWSDSILEKKLRLKLIESKDIRSSSISVIVFLEKAYLTGVVSGNEQTKKIFTICNQVGIPDKSIISNLVVKNRSIREQISDSLITSKIKSAYFADEELSAINLHVATANRTVVLVGLVDSMKQFKRAEEIAIKAGGTTVKNYILLSKKS